eukprot:TRINITY_DN7385_c3_g1_i1.p1 TRINITY_DN7385_c3_g1~~TRINITY_DN7385_c3_g1_i1.p1  ORF type:complete len:118 (-),score=25.67 TRINITY_DN7385_c3_g1_i1:152-505(-)
MTFHLTQSVISERKRAYVQNGLVYVEMNSFEFIHSFTAQDNPRILSSSSFFIFSPQVPSLRVFYVVLKKTSSTSSFSSKSFISLEFELERKLKTSLPEVTSKCFTCLQNFQVLFSGF